VVPHHNFAQCTFLRRSVCLARAGFGAPQIPRPNSCRRLGVFPGDRSRCFTHFSVGREPTTGALVAGGIAAETERVFRNLSAVSKAAGRSFDDVVRAGVHPANMNDFVAMNGIYATHFSQPFPARTTIAVAAPWGLR